MDVGTPEISMLYKLRKSVQIPITALHDASSSTNANKGQMWYHAQNKSRVSSLPSAATKPSFMVHRARYKIFCTYAPISSGSICT